MKKQKHTLPFATRLRQVATALGLAAISAGALAAVPAEVLHLRLMPTANVADPERKVSAEELAVWSQVAGLQLKVASMTPTGGVNLEAPAGTTAAAMRAAMNKLRGYRDLLWVDLRSPAKEGLAKRTADDAPTGNIVIALKRAVALQYTTDAARTEYVAQIGSEVGQLLRFERALDNGTWVLQMPQAMSGYKLSQLIDRISQRSDVRFADPVGKARPRKAPNDALFWSQWAYGIGPAGMNLPAAWELETGGVTVAVLDTGVLPHPDLVGKLLSGYDFISNKDFANDGDGRDNDATDPGDWVTLDEYFNPNSPFYGCPPSDSSWHGTFVSGQIAASANNGVGIAGVSWGARILPVRVLGKCGGSFTDIVDAIRWSAGLPVSGVPANPNPARVLNLSLGALIGTCPSFVQAAFDQVIARGAIPVIASGNDTADVSGDAPAGCSGVVSVAALGPNGDLADYSNRGAKTDIAAPGGDFTSPLATAEKLILGLTNVGTSSPKEYGYTHQQGTSMAAPHVAGVLSLMLARNSALTYGEALSVLFRSARPFPSLTYCGAVPETNGCGAGMLDANRALAMTPLQSGTAPAVVKAIEYRNAYRDHYMITADPVEIAALDGPSSGWARTGKGFFVYPPDRSPAELTPVCRFTSTSAFGLPIYYWTASQDECELIRKGNTGWIYQGPSFAVPMPNYGECPAGAKSVYRVFNRRTRDNEVSWRFIVDPELYIEMQNQGWEAQGIALCAIYD